MAPLASLLRWLGRSGKRIAITAVGFTVLVAGLVMMVAPGPGIAAIVLGLAILATEYVWAQRALHRAKQRGEQAAGFVRSKIRKPNATPPGGTPDQTPP